MSGKIRGNEKNYLMMGITILCINYYLKDNIRDKMYRIIYN